MFLLNPTGLLLLFFCLKMLFSLLKYTLLHLDTSSFFRMNSIHFPLGRCPSPAPKAVLGCPSSTLSESFKCQIEIISFLNLTIKHSNLEGCKGFILMSTGSTLMHPAHNRKPINLSPAEINFVWSCPRTNGFILWAWEVDDVAQAVF